MLRGELVALRAPQESDVPVLHAELHDDVETRSRTVSRAWRPIPVGSPQSPYAIAPPTDEVAKFSVVCLGDGEPADGALAGEALLWGIDQHNRLAHVGMSLLPAYRGRGLATDIVKVLCHYGFVVLGLHRLQIETLADNAAMIKAATRNGFTLEGTLRGNAFVMGHFVDEVILGRVAD